MELIQEIKMDNDINIKIYYTDNLDLNKFGIDDYKIAQIIIPHLDKFKDMIKFREKFDFEIEGKKYVYSFTYTDDLLLLTDINSKGESENDLEDDDIIIFEV